MKTWYMDDQNRLHLTYGQIKLVEDMEALRVLINAELQIVKGELDNPTRGVDYFGIILSNTPISIKVQEITRVIKSVPGVKDVTFNNAMLDKKTQILTFSFTIQTVYGDLEYDKAFANIG